MAGIFMSGGCVIRDTFEQLQHEHELTGYVARQSLISAASPPAELPAGFEPAGFEDRQMAGDLTSSLFGRIEEVHEQTDLLVMDLLVERLGVIELPGGTYATRTPYLNRSGLLGELFDTAPRLKLGTREHFELWKPAARHLLEKLSSLGMLERTLLVETPFATTTITGTPVKPYAGWSPEIVLAKYSIYYAFLRDGGMPSARIPDELVISDDEHKWGASPFHYAKETHDWLRDTILEALPAPTLDDGPVTAAA
ncbi:DUF6270 domain-containing protein [Tessaracoccus sp. MC1756]|uniref:DUF6270 domain-containing protein n=1 Tax=Tessaracoccus sp. MC1756 TaxID=2760311 RepID=UPI001603E3C8|nr:DUF6270 domain-containing protein [Tessaracoccus sp. MC1756]MBB1510683.1 hypothetical protein [Tessaracoccus sp. MC1756]